MIWLCLGYIESTDEQSKKEFVTHYGKYYIKGSSVEGAKDSFCFIILYILKTEGFVQIKLTHNVWKSTAWNILYL